MIEQAQGAQPRLAMLIPTARQSQVLTPDALRRLSQLAEVQQIDGNTAALAERLSSLLASAEICLTGWGSPPITDEALDAAPRLRLIAHTAGSVKRLIPASTFQRGVVVCHAANIIADAVAEHTLLVMLLGLRRVHEMDRALKSGVSW